MGDASDNIPGVKGIGEKTAVNLVARYGSIEKIYDSLAGIEGAAAKKLSAGRDDAFLSKRLAALRDDAPLGLKSLEGIKITLNRAAAAQDYLDAHKALVGAARYRTLSGTIAATTLSERVSAMKTFKDAQAALAILDDPAATAALDPKQVSEARNAVLNNAAIFLSKEQGLAEAIAFAEQSLAKYGRNPALERNLSAFKQNRVAALHNNFARLWNSGKKDEARAFLQDALAEFPDNATLQNDWRVIQQSASGQRRR
jgi:5'-3' exonuclease